MLKRTLTAAAAAAFIATSASAGDHTLKDINGESLDPAQTVTLNYGENGQDLIQARIHDNNEHSFTVRKDPARTAINGKHSNVRMFFVTATTGNDIIECQTEVKEGSVLSKGSQAHHNLFVESLVHGDGINFSQDNCETKTGYSTLNVGKFAPTGHD